MKNLVQALLIVVCSSFVFSCNRHIVNTTTTTIEDSTKVSHQIDTSAVLVANDSARFDSLITELLSLEGELNRLKSDTNKVNEVKEKQKTVIKYLTKGVYKDTTYSIDLKVLFESQDTTFVQISEINVKFKDGKLSHTIHSEEVYVPKKITNNTTTINRRTTMWSWIKDGRTLTLLLLLIILMLILIKQR